MKYLTKNNRCNNNVSNYLSYSVIMNVNKVIKTRVAKDLWQDYILTY